MVADEHWQMDASAPELYERYLVPAITSIWANDLLDRTRPTGEESVLDVACGTGVVARLLEQRGHAGRLVGIDLNAAMLAVARTRSVRVEWIEGSALELPFKADCFDVVLCQLGLQFFPDRSRALEEMARVLKPGGRVGLSVYSAIERTPVAHAFVQALEKFLGAESSRTKRSEHLSCDADEVGNWLRQAGFNAVNVLTVSKQISFPSMLDYVRFQLTATPMAALLQGEDAAGRERMIVAIADDAVTRLDPAVLANGGLTFPQESFVVLASKGEVNGQVQERPHTNEHRTNADKPFHDRALLLHGLKRNKVLSLEEVQQYGSDSFSDPEYIRLYGMTPPQWYERGVRLLGRTAVECTRDAVADRIGQDVAAVAASLPSGTRWLVLDPFAGSCNTLYWILRHVSTSRGIAFE